MCRKSIIQLIVFNRSGGGLLQMFVDKLHDHLPTRLCTIQYLTAGRQSWELTKKHATASVLHW